MMFLLALVLTVNPQAFRHYKKSGTEPFCLVDYQAKTVQCDYKTLNDCRDQYQNHKCVLCFTKKRLNMGDTE